MLLTLSTGIAPSAAAQDRAVPFARYVPADVNIYVATRKLENVSASFDRANAWRLLQFLSGEDDGARPALLTSVAGFFGLSDQSADWGFMDLEVGVTAPSWSDLGEAVWLLRPANESVLERLFPSRGRTEPGKVGDAAFFRTRTGLMVGTLDDTAVIGRRSERGSTLAQALELMGGRSSDSLVVSPAFRELAAYLPANPLALVYAAGSAIAAANPSEASRWRPTFDRAAVGLYERQGRIDIAVNAVLAHPRKKPKLSDLALERLFRLPDTTLLASVFTFDFDDALRAAVSGNAPKGTFGRYLRFLAALQPSTENAGAGLPKLGPHVILVWGQNLSLGGSMPQVAILVECREGDGVDARASAIAEQAVRLFRMVDRSNAAAPLSIERTRHLGATISHVSFEAYAKTSQTPFAQLLSHADPAWSVHNGWLIVGLSIDHVESIVESELGLMPRLGELRDVRPLRHQSMDRSVLSVLQAGVAADVLKEWVAAYQSGSPSLLDPKWWNAASERAAGSPSPFGFQMAAEEEPGAVVVSRVYPRSVADGRLEVGDRVIGIDGTLLTMHDANADFRSRWDDSTTAPGLALRILRGSGVVEVTLPKSALADAGPTDRINPAAALRELASLGRTLEFAGFGVNVTDERHYSARLSLRFVPEPSPATAATAASDTPLDK